MTIFFKEVMKYFKQMHLSKIRIGAFCHVFALDFYGNYLVLPLSLWYNRTIDIERK